MVFPFSPQLAALTSAGHSGQKPLGILISLSPSPLPSTLLIMSMSPVNSILNVYSILFQTHPSHHPHGHHANPAHHGLATTASCLDSLPSVLPFKAHPPSTFTPHTLPMQKPQGVAEKISQVPSSSRCGPPGPPRSDPTQPAASSITLSPAAFIPSYAGLSSVLQANHSSPYLGALHLLFRQLKYPSPNLSITASAYLSFILNVVSLERPLLTTSLSGIIPSPSRTSPRFIAF